LACRYSQQIQTACQACAVREREFCARPRQIITENEAQRTAGDARCIVPGTRDLEWNRRMMLESQQQRRVMAGNPVE